MNDVVTMFVPVRNGKEVGDAQQSYSDALKAAVARGHGYFSKVILHSGVSIEVVTKPCRKTPPHIPNSQKAEPYSDHKGIGRNRKTQSDEQKKQTGEC